LIDGNSENYDSIFVQTPEPMRADPAIAGSGIRAFLPSAGGASRWLIAASPVCALAGASKKPSAKLVAATVAYAAATAATIVILLMVLTPAFRYDNARCGRHFPIHPTE
jgi:hypothetical protein